MSSILLTNCPTLALGFGLGFWIAHLPVLGGGIGFWWLLASFLALFLISIAGQIYHISKRRHFLIYLVYKKLLST